MRSASSSWMTLCCCLAPGEDGAAQFPDNEERASCTKGWQGGRGGGQGGSIWTVCAVALLGALLLAGFVYYMVILCCVFCVVREGWLRRCLAEQSVVKSLCVSGCATACPLGFVLCSCLMCTARSICVCMQTCACMLMWVSARILHRNAKRGRARVRTCRTRACLHTRVHIILIKGLPRAGHA